MSHKERGPLLPGTLDLIVLRTLLFGPLHGHGIGKAIRSTSDEILSVDHGSLYPALYRLEQRGWIASKWEKTPKGRPMKFYRLTSAGRKQLTVEQSKWEQLVRGIRLILKRQVE